MYAMPPYLKLPISHLDHTLRPCECLREQCACCVRISNHMVMIPHNLLLVGASAVTFSACSSVVNTRCTAFLSGTRPAPVRAAKIDDRRRGVHSSHTCGRPPSRQAPRGVVHSEEFRTSLCAHNYSVLYVHGSMSCNFYAVDDAPTCCCYCYLVLCLAAVVLWECKIDVESQSAGPSAGC